MIDGENLPEIPQSWIWVKFYEILEVGQGGTPSTAIPEYWNGSIPWLRSGEIRFNRIKESKETISESGLRNSPARLLPKGTVLLAMTGQGLTRGRAAILDTDASGNQSCAHLIPQKNVITSEFLFYYFRAEYWKVRSFDKGSNQPGLNTAIIKEFTLPLPPYSEQHRIVTKIEELFTQLDAGVASLKKAQAQLKRYRQAVLKAAFEGRLTQEWREEHKGEIEPADVLIKTVRKKTESDKYSITDQATLPQLPEGWVWTKLGQLTDMSAGKAFLKSEYSENGVNLLQIANVSFGKIVWDVVTYLPQDYLAKYPELVLKEGDMLIALNRPILDGKLKIGILKERDAPSILYQRVGRFDLYNPEFRDFIFYFAQSPHFINYFNKSLQGIEIPFINKPVLLNACIAFPPIKEQNVIVSEIERIFSICDEIEQTITTSLLQSESLRQSILKRAFEGKLVPQDPNDEPASILLERIMAEKARHTAATKKGKALQPKTPKRKIKNAH